MHSKWSKLLLTLIVVISIALYFFTIYTMMSPTSKGDTLSYSSILHLQLFATIILFSLLITVPSCYYYTIICSRFSEFVKNLLLSFATTLCLFVLLELYFLHKEESNAIGPRWSAFLWDKKHMTTRTSYSFINSNGNIERVFFRYNVFNKTNQKKAIWFLGDSFTYGFGLENTNQTFPAITEQLLHNRVHCLNLGDGGADSRREKEVLFALTDKTPVKPLAVVWQYFGNDIDANDEGPETYERKMKSNLVMKLGVKFFKEKSFLLDYIYWQFFLLNEQNSIADYSTFLGELYKNKQAYIAHLEHIREAADYCQLNNIPFVVVIFPFLWENGPENAQHIYANRIAHDLHQLKTDVIDLTPLLKNLPVSERVVNIHDPHPSSKVNSIVADTIAQYLKNKVGI